MQDICINDDDIIKMRKLAKRKAFKLVRWRDDVDIVAEDMEQDGWERFCWAIRLGKTKEMAFLEAKSWMSKCFVKWKYNILRSFTNRRDDQLELQDIDLRPLMSLEPSVEQMVLGMELIRHFEQNLNKDKTLDLLECMILKGSPNLRGSNLSEEKRLNKTKTGGRDKTKNNKRRQRIQEYTKELLEL